MWHGCEGGEGLLGEESGCAASSLHCRKQKTCTKDNWQFGKERLQDKVVSFALLLGNTKHSLETAEAAVIQDWYAQLCLGVCISFKAGCSPTRLTGEPNTEGQRRAKPSTCPPLGCHKDKRSASQGWQHSIGSFWASGASNKMLSSCRSTTNSIWIYFQNTDVTKTPCLSDNSHACPQEQQPDKLH